MNAPNKVPERKAPETKLAVADAGKKAGRGVPLSPEAKAAKEKENRARFEKLGAGRVTKAIKAIRAFAACSNTRSYKFTEADVKAGVSALHTEVDDALAAYEVALRGGSPEAKAVEFKFGA